ncbi:MAG: iron ABC transporter permease [Lachnospiraceae bacterium]|nr:iron ABC transporter permease [Lachnospiraceae bacterium]
MCKTDRSRTFLPLVWYGVMGFLLLGYILLPFVRTVLEALRAGDGYGLLNFHEFFSNPNQWTVAKNTILLGVSMVVTCGAIGILLALYMTFLCGRFKKLIHILLLSPMMVPGVITVIAFIQLYGESGVVTKAIQYALQLPSAPFVFQGYGAILFVITYTQYVYFYLNVYVALKYMDYAAIEAARSLGASWLQIFRDVIWPVIRPAVFTSVIITFASGVSAFSAPNLIGGGFKVLSTQIVRSKANNHMEMASVQVVVLFAISVTVMLLVRFYSRRFGSIAADRSQPAVPEGMRRGWLAVLGRIVVLIQILLILLPIAAIIYLSFISTSSIMQDIFPHSFTLENYLTIFRKKRVLKPLINSLQMSVMAVAAGLVLTVPSAYLIVRRGGRAEGILRFALMLPSAMPASLVAINLINAFNQKSLFAFGQVLIGGYYIIPIAYVITALPMLLSSNEVAIQGLHPNLEEASRSLGADMGNTFARIILPNIAPGIMAGGILIFIRMIGEYTMSALLYGVHNRPISISIITNMQEYNVGISLAYGVIVILICYLSLALIFRLDDRRFL